MISRYVLFLIIGIDALILSSQTLLLSISYEEAKLLYGDFSFLQLLVQFSLNLFGHNDFGLRFVMLLFHTLSVLLIYLISFDYLAQERNRLWMLLMFVLLPGVLSSAVMVNSAGMIIFGLLLYIYLHTRVRLSLLNLLLLCYALIDVGFAYLFVGLAFFYLYNKNVQLFTYNLALYLLTSFLYGFEILGYPSGHFLDTVGVYSAIFTPIIFIYLFYVLYRRALTKKVDIIWFIATTSLIFSLILSFRQSVPIEHFAPYLIVALPLGAQTFASSYRIRLKEHRKFYKTTFIISFVFLLLNALAVFFNKELYLLMDEPKKHFAYDVHIAKELSQNLYEKGIECVKTDYKMQLRLEFYGIKKCDAYLLRELKDKVEEMQNVTISYKNVTLYRGYVTKVNK
ncbi:MAG: hypothetical protein JXQ67_01130 [Campylobacterales bacterium]|nr:hypothetical protein [Campylobacterales bacterium]